MSTTHYSTVSTKYNKIDIINQDYSLLQAIKTITKQLWPIQLKNKLNNKLIHYKLINTNTSKSHYNKDKFDIDIILKIETAGSRLVFIDGNLSYDYSNYTKLPNKITLTNLISYYNSDHITHTNNLDLITNINTANFSDGAILIIPEDIHVQVPIHIIFIHTSSNDNLIHTPRLQVILKQNSSATLIEEYQGYGHYITFASTEITIEQNAHLTHQTIQQESTEAYHFHNLFNPINRGRYTYHNFSLGSAITWQTNDVILTEQHSYATTNELIIAANNQINIMNTITEHQEANCHSEQNCSIIANDTSSTDFNGKTLVQRNANHTRSVQKCQGITLSPKAEIIINPQLQIHTDDVNCSHAATIGQLDNDVLFYIQSRGLSLEETNTLLTFAFASCKINKISLPSIKKQIHEVIATKIKQKSHTETSNDNIFSQQYR